MAETLQSRLGLTNKMRLTNYMTVYSANRKIRLEASKLEKDHNPYIKRIASLLGISCSSRH